MTSQYANNLDAGMGILQDAFAPSSSNPASNFWVLDYSLNEIAKGNGTLESMAAHFTP